MLTGFKPTLSLLISLLEPAVNRVIRLDDRHTELLHPLKDKVIAIELTDMKETLYIFGAEHGLQFMEDYPYPPDAKLSGTLTGFGFMGLSSTPMHSLYKGEIRMEGDTLVAHKLQSLFKKLDIQLESRMATVAGEKIAQQLTGFWKSGKQWTQDSQLSFRLNLEEFLQEETQELPAKSEAEMFFYDVDVLRMDTDRLEAKIQRLKNQVSPTEYSDNPDKAD